MTAKILFLGFDGSDHAFMDAMMAEGELPTFRRLRDQSAVRLIENDPAMGAAQFWNSASIGKGPAHHGHYFYMQFNPETYDIVPNHEASLPDITPFWNQLDEEGFKVAAIDWHRMMPKPMKNGVMIDNWLTHDPLTGPVWSPASLAQEAARYFNGDPIAGGYEFLNPQTAKEMNDYLRHLLNRTDAKAAFCAEQLKGADWDLYIACFPETHDIGHHLYHLDDEAHENFDAQLAALVRQPLRQAYRKQDAAIAKMIDAAGPDVKVIVYGGPGMEPSISANGAMDEILRRIDLGVAAPRSSAEIAKQSYRSYLPESVRRRVAPLARAIRRQFANHDYKRRRFFSVPHNDNAGAIRINLQGREKFGVVAPGAELEAVMKEISDGFSSFVNVDTGRPLVRSVVCVPHEFDGPYRDVLPDMFIEWDRRETRSDFRKVRSELYGDMELETQHRSGDHNPSGFFWAPREIDTASIARPEDITAPVMTSVRAACG